MALLKVPEARILEMHEFSPHITTSKLWSLSYELNFSLKERGIDRDAADKLHIFPDKDVTARREMGNRR